MAVVNWKTIEIHGRDVTVDPALATANMEEDNKAEKVRIIMDRYYNGADFDTKEVMMFLFSPDNREIQIPLNQWKTTADQTLTFDVTFTESMLYVRGYYNLVFKATDQTGYNFSTRQVDRALYVDSNFTVAKQVMAAQYYVDLGKYKTEIVGNVADAEDAANKAKVSETNAKASETAAAQSAANALTSEQNAKTSETNAANSAAHAKSEADRVDGLVNGFDQKVVDAKAEIDAEGTKQVGLVTAEGAKQRKAIDDEGDAQRQLIDNEGTKQVGLVTAEGNKQVANIQAQVNPLVQQAQTAANNAAASEAAADIAETNAKASEDAASDSAIEAEASKTAAAQSAGAAKTSETNAKASETAAANSAAAADGAVKKHVTLDSKEQANFNLCQSEVEKDGLQVTIEKKIYTGNNITFVSKGNPYQNSFSYQMSVDNFDLSTGIDVYVIGTWTLSQVDVIALRRKINYISYRYLSTNGTYRESSIGGLSSVSGSVYESVFVTQGKIVVISNGKTIIKNIPDMASITSSQISSITMGGYSSSTQSKGVLNYFLFYNRALSPQETQHNFQVLSSNPTISSIEVTDADNNKKEFAITNDSYHTIMDTGHNLQEELDGYRAVMGQEFVSDGSDISVSNAIDKSKVLEVEMKGRTVKALTCNEDLNVTIIGRSDGISFKSYGGLLSSGYVRNNIYTLVVFVTENTCNKGIAWNGYGAVSNLYWNGILNFIPSGFVGIKKLKLQKDKSVSESAFLATFGLEQGAVGSVKFSWCILDGDYTNVDLPINSAISGLNSTIAQVNIDGKKYPFAEPTIQGTTSGVVPTDPTLPTLNDGDVLDIATKTITFKDGTKRTLTTEELKAYSQHEKVISLRQVGDVADTLTQSLDGSSLLEIKNYPLKMDGTNIANAEYANGSDATYVTYHSDTNLNAIDVMCSTLSKKSKATSKEKGCVAEGGYLYITLPRTELSTNDRNGFIDALADSEFIYSKTTQTTTTIDKRATPHIPVSSTQINISCGEAISPSSFKATVPTTTKLDEIASLTTAVTLMQQQIHDLQNP